MTDDARKVNLLEHICVLWEVDPSPILTAEIMSKAQHYADEPPRPYDVTVLDFSRPEIAITFLIGFIGDLLARIAHDAHEVDVAIEILKAVGQHRFEVVK